MADDRYSSIHYTSYLQIDKLLDAQKMRSEELGEPAHEEMLFIIVHQVYELWFKQINHEVRSLLKMFGQGIVNEKNMGTAVSRLERVVTILNHGVDQIKILETMTPLDFLDFRNYLFPASGFQSFQFREMEVMLGLKEDIRTTYNDMKYASVFTKERRNVLSDLEHNKSLFELVGDWLERTPFLELDDFNFISYYKDAVERMLKREQDAIKQTEVLSEEQKAMRLQMLGNTSDYFSNIFNQERHESMIESGEVRLSYKATVAALLINLYRDEPILQMPFRLLSTLVELDDVLTTWRYRHAQMVMRMLGRKVGTGGSSGYDYLARTATKHKIFKDFHNVSTLLIPRSDLPDLPESVKRNFGYFFSAQ